MSKNAISTVLWLALLVLAIEINTIAFNSFIYSKFDTSSEEYYYGTPMTDTILLFVSAITFGMAGWVIAWRIRDRYKSFVLAVFLGTFSLGLEFIYSFPWYLLMPSHPGTYDLVLAFMGPSIPPIFAGLGAFGFARIYINENRENAL